MDEFEQIQKDDLFEPIERLFEREYEAEHGLFRSGGELNFANGHDPDWLVDMLYLAGSREQLHGIRIRTTYDACLFDIHDGIHTLGDAPANYRWIALPLDEFRDGEEEYSEIMHKTCEKRGYGIITVQIKGRGLSAKVILKPVRETGNFLGAYQGLAEDWNKRVGTDEVIDGYQVVDYYDR